MAVLCRLWACHLRRILGLLLAAAALPRTLATTCTQVDRLAVQLPRPLQPEFAGFVVPNSVLAAGAPQYSSECLQVNVQGGGVGFDPLTELAAGRADVAIAEGAYVAQKIGGGEDYTVVAGYYQRNGLLYIGLNKVSSLQDLVQQKGGVFPKIGVWGLGYDLPFRAVMAGITPVVPVTYEPQNMETMEQLWSGELDVVTAMSSGELAHPLTWLDSKTNFLRQRSSMYVLDPADHGIPSMHNVAVVKTSQLSSLRAKLVKFFSTVTKAWIFCRDNEDACAAAFSEFGEPSPLLVWQMRETNRLVFPTLKAHGLGVMSRQTWNDMNAYLVKLGAIQAAVPDTVIDNTVVLDADALGNTTIWEIAPGPLHFCAPYGSEDYYICQGFEHTYCSGGRMPSGPNDNDCVPCTLGRFAPKAGRMNKCEICAPGRYAKTIQKQWCNVCEAGTFWHPTAAAADDLPADCLQCAVGRFTFSRGASECRSCPGGLIATTEGQTECERCPHGSYAGGTASSACLSCLPRMTTVFNGAQSQSECICAEGFYLSMAGACTECPEGMSCAQDSKESVLRSLSAGTTGEYPRLKPGYWSSETAPLSVYLCWDVNACPGGNPGTCGSNMEGVACGLCKDGYYRDGKKCLECTVTDESPFNYPLLQVIFGPFIVFALYWLARDSQEDWKNWRNELGSLCILLLMAYQMVGLVVATAIDWPEEISSALWPWYYLVEVPDMLRLQCSEYRFFRNRLLVKTTAPLLLLGVFLVAYVVFLLVGMVFSAIRTSRSEKGSEAGGGGFLDVILSLAPLDINVMGGLFLAVLWVFYISLCFISLQLFMCYDHPNGERSLRFGPEVSCDSGSSDDWEGMLTEAILSIIFYIVGMIIGFIYIVAIAPRHFQDTDFRTRWNFLFRRFKPDCWWWSPVLMFRALLMVLTLTLSMEGLRQVYWMFCVLLLYGALLVTFFPWRHRTANLIDAFCCGIVLFFCALGATFGKRPGWLDDSLARTAAAITFSPLPAVVVLSAWVLWTTFAQRVQKRTKVEQSKLASDARASFTKVVALDKAASHAFVQSLSEQDRDTFRGTCAVIVAELLGHQPGKAGLKWRLVHQEQRSGAHKWAPQSPASQGSDKSPAADITL